MSKSNAPFSQKQQVAASMIRPRGVTAAPPRDCRRRRRRIRRLTASARRRPRGRFGVGDGGVENGDGEGRKSSAQSALSAAARGGRKGSSPAWGRGGGDGGVFDGGIAGCRWELSTLAAIARG